MINEKNKQIVEDIQKAIGNYFKNIIYYKPTYIKMENNEIKVITDLYGIDRRMVIEIPRRYRKRLLKQGYIIFIGYLGRKMI